MASVRTAPVEEHRELPRVGRPSAGVLPVLGVVVLIALLVRPMVIGRTFIGYDWYPHQWYIWHQAHSIQANLVPSLFAYDTTGVFNPHYAFYGGTLYALAGLVTIVVGDAGAAMVIVLVGAFAAGYGGWWWLARQAGLDRWVAHVPAILFVTAPFQLAIIYSTGGFAEFVAISAIPLLVAGALTVMRSDRLRLGPAALLAVGVILFTGSHNVTLLWGTTFLALVAALALLFVPGARALVTRASVGRLAAVAVPALLVNAWFLLPDLAYGARSFIASAADYAGYQLLMGMNLVDAKHLFTLSRATAWVKTPHHALGLPLLAVAWTLLALVVARRGWRSSWFRLAVVLLATTVPFYLLMTNYDWLWGLPKPYNFIQFSYRLETYIVLAVLGALVATLALVGPLGGGGGGRRGGIAAGLLGLVAAASIVGAVAQLRQGTPSPEPLWKKAAPYLTQKGDPNSRDYSSNELEVLAPGPDLQMARFPVSAEDGNHASVTLDASPGEIVRSNIIAMPPLVHLTGARFIGREDTGQGVLEIDPDSSSTKATLSVSPAHPWPVTFGRILSVLGLLGLAFGAARLIRRR